ncbi:MAG: CTP synthase [Deinococcota bacterium]
MEQKYIFITGGVVSSLGKGIVTSSLGALLRARGIRVTAVKIDPYINVDAGTMRPYEHGEVFVTADGAETDLDIGTYERFLNSDLSRTHNITTGQVYQAVISKERRGEYLAQTVQVIPHVTDEIQARIDRASIDSHGQHAEVVLVEVGGTVGDIESLPFLEAIRQMRFAKGFSNTLYLHVTLLPFLSTSQELKTKPTQHSVATLRSVGIQPDALVLRSERPAPEDIRDKLALFTNVEPSGVFSSYNSDHIYAVPEMLEQQGLGRFVEKRLGLEKVTPELGGWQRAVHTLRHPESNVTIGIIGKYVAMPDAYLSLTEALVHAGIANKAKVNLRWVNAEELIEDGLAQLSDLDGILVPGGFGVRGIEGKVQAAKVAREQHIPFLGICLGMQVAVIDYARHVAGIAGANSTEFDPYTPHSVIDLMPEQLELDDMGGTMRLGNWPMKIKQGTRLHTLYHPSSDDTALERHRHRYEVNPQYVQQLEQAGLTISGTTPGMKGRGVGLVEAIELADHPFFVGVQSHPEFGSRLARPSPPFRGFIAAALAYQTANLISSSPTSSVHDAV